MHFSSEIMDMRRLILKRTDLEKGKAGQRRKGYNMNDTRLVYQLQKAGMPLFSRQP